MRKAYSDVVVNIIDLQVKKYHNTVVVSVKHLSAHQPRNWKVYDKRVGFRSAKARHFRRRTNPTANLSYVAAQTPLGGRFPWRT